MTEHKSCWTCKHDRLPVDEEPCLSCLVRPVGNLNHNWEPNDD